MLVSGEGLQRGPVDVLGARYGVEADCEPPAAILQALAQLFHLQITGSGRWLDGGPGWSRGWTSEDMDKNVLQFKKSEYVRRTAKELVDNCIETLTHIKNLAAEKIKAPTPRKQDSFSAGQVNPDMNV